MVRMDSDRVRTGTARMRPRARLVGLIGEELISDEPVALVELVKNAYDADATRVEIRFEPDRAETAIVVEDNGHGMALNTLLTAWFEPGTVSKRRIDRSPGGRIYQGAKGIGRFASARLAESLYLESRVSGSDTGIMALLEWGSFNEASYLDEIEIAYEVGQVRGLEAGGTRLTLEKLRKNWNAEDFEELHSRLSRLISPFEDVSDFAIELFIPGHPEFSGQIQPPELILTPRYLLRGALDAAGSFTGELQYEGETVHKLRRRKLGGEAASPICGPFEIEIRAWDRDRQGLEPLVQRLSLGIQEIRRTLDSYSGVSIYRDGFRVYPYGRAPAFCRNVRLMGVTPDVWNRHERAGSCGTTAS
jgi:anti-sigma regulatory factor (Ser/Thr protein kinase)